MSETSPASVLRDPVLTWTGTTSSLFGIFFRNLLLTIITAGVYRFWAITNMRCYLWSNTRVAGQPLEYTGTGGELLRGFLLAIGTMILLLLAAMAVGFGIATLLGFSHSTFVWGLVIFYLTLLPLAFAAVFLGRRYLMTRTQLRGIRFGQDGSPIGYGFSMLGRMLLCAITLGFHMPWMQAAALRKTVGATRWGSAKFDFKGKGIELFGWYVLAFLCSAAAMIAIAPVIFSIMPFPDGSKPPSPEDIRTMFTPGRIAVLAGAYFFALLAPTLVLWAAMWHFTFKNITIDSDAMRFNVTASIGRIVLLLLGNMLIVIFSLGLLTPIAIQRIMQFLTAHITLTGALDLSRITQAPEENGRLSNIIGAGFNT